MKDKSALRRIATSMRVLLTNDDGIHAEGLLALKIALEKNCEVYVVAPDRPRSATSHSISLHKPLRLHEVKLGDGSMGYSSNGKPTDCVSLGLDVVMKGDCDIVISGINAGANLGWDVTYSGTVGAAFEGAVLGAQSIAVSVCASNGYDTIRWESACDFTVKLVEKLRINPMPSYITLNVNVPNLPPDSIKGVKTTFEGVRKYGDRLDARADPWGQTYYWLSGELLDIESPEGSDVKAVNDGYISVTPLQLDMTAYEVMDSITKLL